MSEVENKVGWIMIDENYREKLPKEDCELWITRVSLLTDRWVQKIEYYADTKDIEWDGTIAFMIATDDNKPDPCNNRKVSTVQNYR